MTWIMTLAHRRAVDRVRSGRAAAPRQDRAGRAEIAPAADQVAEAVLDRLDRQQVRDCLGRLTGAQRESVTLAYYGGYTYRAVAARTVPPPGEPYPPAHRRTGPARRPLRRPRVATLAAAACLAVAAAAGAIAVHDQQRLGQLTAASQAASAVLSAPGARATTAHATGGGTLTLISAPTRHQVVVASAGLPPLPDSHTHQLWTMGPAGPRPAGLLRPDTTGHTPLQAATVPSGANRVALTVEPAGGSAQPTTTPIVVLPL